MVILKFYFSGYSKIEAIINNIIYKYEYVILIYIYYIKKYVKKLNFLKLT